MLSKWYRNLQRSACNAEKTTKPRANIITNCTKKHPSGVSHERGFRILRCIQVGLWASWAPRPSHTRPQDTSKPRYLGNLYAIWSDLSSIHGAYFQKMFAVFLIIGVHSGTHFSTKHGKCNKQVGWHPAHILGTVAGLPKALG